MDTEDGNRFPFPGEVDTKDDPEKVGAKRGEFCRSVEQPSPSLTNSLQAHGNGKQGRKREQKAGLTAIRITVTGSQKAAPVPITSFSQSRTTEPGQRRTKEFALYSKYRNRCSARVKAWQPIARDGTKRDECADSKITVAGYEA